MTAPTCDPAADTSCWLAGQPAAVWAGRARLAERPSPRRPAQCGVGRSALHRARPDCRRCGHDPAARRGASATRSSRSCSRRSRRGAARQDSSACQSSARTSTRHGKGEGLDAFLAQAKATAFVTSSCHSCRLPSVPPIARASSSSPPLARMAGGSGRVRAAALLSQSRVRVRPGPRRHDGGSTC